MAELASQTLRVTLHIDGVKADALLPSAARVEEKINAPRRITVDLPIDPGAVRPADMLRKGAQLDVSLGGNEARRFEGVVLAVKEVWHGAGPVFTLTIGSPIDFLALSTDCRIFQEMTVPEIVEKVLTEAGFPAARIKKRLSGTYAKLESCTQYRRDDARVRVAPPRGRGRVLLLRRRLGRARARACGRHGCSSPLRARQASLRRRRRPPREDGRCHIDGGGDAPRDEGDVARSRLAEARADLEASSENKGVHARELYDHPGGYTTPAEGSGARSCGWRRSSPDRRACSGPRRRRPACLPDAPSSWNGRPR